MEVGCVAGWGSSPTVKEGSVNSTQSSGQTDKRSPLLQSGYSTGAGDDSITGVFYSRRAPESSIFPDAPALIQPTSNQPTGATEYRVKVLPNMLLRIRTGIKVAAIRHTRASREPGSAKRNARQLMRVARNRIHMNISAAGKPQVSTVEMK